MDSTNKDNRFPEQQEPSKVHGTHDDSGAKEKYIRDAGKIEDLPEETETPKMSPTPDPKHESTHLTDRTGEEKREDYINTDERRNDLKRRGLD